MIYISPLNDLGSQKAAKFYIWLSAFHYSIVDKNKYNTEYNTRWIMNKTKWKDTTDAKNTKWRNTKDVKQASLLFF